MAKTACRIDWLSCNMVDPYKQDNEVATNAEWHANIIYDTFGLKLDTEYKPGRQWQHTRLDGPECVLFYGGEHGMTLELTGKACEELHNAGRLVAIVQTMAIVGRVSRLDIAVDMECDVDPRDFVAQRSNKRQKSEETAISSTGITCYIGSRKSDRYARVYRYAEPHDRSHLLRCEMVFRGEQAVLAAEEWLAVGDEEFAARAGNVYGWEHEVFTPKARRN